MYLEDNIDREKEGTMQFSRREYGNFSEVYPMTDEEMRSALKKGWAQRRLIELLHGDQL